MRNEVYVNEVTHITSHQTLEQQILVLKGIQVYVWAEAKKSENIKPLVFFCP